MTRWFPLAHQDARCAGAARYVAAVDPGAETGLALLVCDANGVTRCGVSTLAVPHPACWAEARANVDAEVLCLFGSAGPWLGNGDPRALPWSLCVELSEVHVRGEEAQWAQVNAANSLGPTAYRAGTLLAALAHVLGVGEAPVIYKPQVWRSLLGKGNIQGEKAKRACLARCADWWGATWPVPARVKDADAYRVRELSHEAEAACMGAWHLRELALAARQAAAPVLFPPGALERAGKERGKRRRPLPQAVLDAAERAAVEPSGAPEAPEAG